MAKHLMIDTETLGIGPTAVVLSLGATVFELEPNTVNDFEKYVLDGFYVKFNAKEQVHTYRRKIDASTIEWWKGQSEEAKAVVRPSPDDVLMADGLRALNAWIKTTGYNWNKSYVWCRGNAFDFPKIETMYEGAEVPSGFNTWKIRDVRTYVDVLTGDEWGKYNPQNGTPPSWVAHNALHDAAMDAYRMVEIFNRVCDGDL